MFSLTNWLVNSIQLDSDLVPSGPDPPTLANTGINFVGSWVNIRKFRQAVSELNLSLGLLGILKCVNVSYGVSFTRHILT